MRLDIFLKLSRLIGRRSLAQEFCDAGRIKVNEAVAKSSKEVKTGDLIEISRRNRILTVRVTSVPDKKQVAKADAGDLFEVVSEVTVADEIY